MGMSLISRRSFLKIGMGAGATVLAPHFLGLAIAETPTAFCNPNRPSTPGAALTALIDGNSRWANFDQQHPGEDETRRDCLVAGQQPFAAILSCSDSRLPPQLIFDQGLGDLFVVRVAGNSTTVVGEQSLAYGVKKLGALLLLVLGHQSCGAVSAAVDHFPDEDAERFVKLIYPAVRRARRIVKKNGGNPNDKAQVLPVAIDQNVILTVNQLSNVELFHKAVKAGKLAVVGGRYDLTTQQVTLLTPAP
jgi:carbonic anhydrase